MAEAAVRVRGEKEVVSNVFKTVGQPTITYVERENGALEQRLHNALQTSGQLCLLTGPSKTGKTTLYKKVLAELRKEALIVRCDHALQVDEFWARALESINFTRLRELQSEAKVESKLVASIGAKLGWSWLAEATGQVSAEVAAGLSETAAREAVLAKPAPMHLIPVLRKLPYILVVEDYHYLSVEVRKIIFQQWKHFVDEEVSVIVVGTTHHAIDIVDANRDLMARKIHIEVTSWEAADLGKIVRSGFSFLRVNISKMSVEAIARESVGLPILTQHICEQLFHSQSIYQHHNGTDLETDLQAIQIACISTVQSKLSELKQYYDKLIVGPRKRARKFDTYELVLSCFTKEPMKFELAKHELIQRLQELPIDKTAIPPVGSLNSMLNALESFQRKKNIELLEWSNAERLYILEPSFLFFLRWGLGAERRPTIRTSVKFFGLEFHSEFTELALKNLLTTKRGVVLKDIALTKEIKNLDES